MTSGATTTIGSLFSGYGGLDMAAVEVLGGELAWHCENDPAATAVLAHHWPGVPNLGDITTVDWSTVQPVDVFTGGFPCTDVSLAGRQAGMRPGTRSGLWSHMAYGINRLRPRLVLIENVRGLLSAPADGQVEPCPWCVGDRPDDCVRALGTVLADLAILGYDAVWCGLPASAVGAPHGRFRIFIAATHSNSERPLRTRIPRDGSPRSAHNSLHAPADTGHGPEPQWPRSPRWQARQRTSERQGSLGGRSVAVDWGEYEPAIRRWEGILGYDAPPPTVIGRRGTSQLNPAFSEWMMGIPGHITDVPDIPRDATHQLIGNGVVPQQAVVALHWLLARWETVMDKVTKGADGEWRDEDGRIIPEDTAEIVKDIDAKIERLDDQRNRSSGWR